MALTDEQPPTTDAKDIWTKKSGEEGLTTFKILDKIKDDLTPISSKEYLSFESTNITRLENINREQLGNMEMSDKCLCSIVVPAHNENTNPENRTLEDKRTNIIKFLEAINNQSFSENSGLSPQNFEVFIVDNNSTDGTAEAARSWIEKNKPAIPIKVVSIDFSDEEKGVGSARKLGADLEILRATRRKGGLGEHYLGGLDSDNSRIPKDHFEKIVQTFRNSDALVLKGEVSNDRTTYEQLVGSEADEKYLIDALLDFNDFKINFLTEQSKIHNEFPSLDTSGANHAIKTQWYMRIRGYPPGRTTGEDTYLGRATKALGHGVGFLPSEIVINPRRMLLDPVSYIEGKSWEPQKFLDDNDRVRSGEQSQELQLTSDHIIKAMVKNTDQFALTYLKREGKVSWHDAVVETRKVFNEFCDKRAVPENKRLNNQMFFTGRRVLEDAMKNGDLTIKSEGSTPDLKVYKPFMVTEDFLIEKTEDVNQENPRLVFIKVDSEGVPLL